MAEDPMAWWEKREGISLPLFKPWRQMYAQNKRRTLLILLFGCLYMLLLIIGGTWFFYKYQ